MSNISDLLDAGGILIGSRALGVENDDSDWDIVILEKNLPYRFLNHDRYKDPSDYLNVFPMGNINLLRLYKLDIIIYDEEEDIKAIQDALEYIKGYSKDDLKFKSSRIQLFEAALLHTGRFSYEKSKC